MRKMFLEIDIPPYPESVFIYLNAHRTVCPDVPIVCCLGQAPGQGCSYLLNQFWWESREEECVFSGGAVCQRLMIDAHCILRAPPAPPAPDSCRPRPGDCTRSKAVFREENHN